MAREATPPPAVVLLELQPHAMARAGYEGGALKLLRTMHSWGFTDVSHSGCGPALPHCQMTDPLLPCCRIWAAAERLIATRPMPPWVSTSSKI